MRFMAADEDPNLEAVVARLRRPGGAISMDPSLPPDPHMEDVELLIRALRVATERLDDERAVSTAEKVRLLDALRATEDELHAVQMKLRELQGNIEVTLPQDG
jgi:hypothetical protein